MARARNRPRRGLAWLLCVMLLAFLVSSISLAHAEPDTSGPEERSFVEHGDETHPVDVPEVLDEVSIASAEDVCGPIATDGRPDEPAPANIDPTEESGCAWAYGVPDTRDTVFAPRVRWLGRLDVSITWRRGWNESTDESITARRDEVWLVATWRL